MKGFVLSRRKFIKLLALSSIAGSALAAFASKAAEPLRKLYPGPVKPLDYAEISKPGPWAG